MSKNKVESMSIQWINRPDDGIKVYKGNLSNIFCELMDFEDVVSRQMVTKKTSKEPPVLGFFNSDKELIGGCWVDVKGKTIPTICLHKDYSVSATKSFVKRLVDYVEKNFGPVSVVDDDLGGVIKEHLEALVFKGNRPKGRLWGEYNTKYTR